MDKKLKNLKTQFEHDIPTSFTNKDRQLVLKKISKESNRKQRATPFLPKPITAVLGAAVLFFGLMVANQQWNIVNLSGTNANNGSVIDESVHSLSFDPETIKVGEQFGAFTVSKIELKKDHTIISFEGTDFITADVANDAKLLFTPKDYSLDLLPISNQDSLSNISFAISENEKTRSMFSFSNQDGAIAEDQLMEVNQIQYHINDTESFVTVEISGVSGTNLGESITYSYDEVSVEVTGELLSIYKEYASDKNDMVLRGLKPFDIFKLYYHARSIEDFETVHSLYIKGDKYGTPSLEEFLGDPKFWGATYAENDQAFYEELKQVRAFNEVYVSETESAVNFTLPSHEYGRHFSLTKDTNTNVWKVNWIPMQ
ncbi:hypothetical protein HNQ94_003246 [Salirhabdus euzebyi]|uniref:DUF4179 domain-containing protein n=1 Tax=Salirhabdus euzebyi TaxID=394506 RepID=A0A841Q915_9BACI|nr:hypothetical protein [Salirhabdus euzebyi]MBB6454757.1 hypothetical protein [Salirhabdus euzebyi]